MFGHKKKEDVVREELPPQGMERDESWRKSEKVISTGGEKVVGERVVASTATGERSQEVVEKVEAHLEGAMAAEARIVQPFRHERYVTSHLEPRKETVEVYKTHNEHVTKIVPTPVPSERVILEEVEETINVQVQVQEPRIEPASKTVPVDVESEVVELVDVEKTIPVKVMVKEARIKKIMLRKEKTVGTEAVKMITVTKTVPVKIRKMVPRVEKISRIADVKVEIEQPVIDKIQEQRTVMDKVQEIHDKVVPDGPAQLRAGPVEMPETAHTAAVTETEVTTTTTKIQEKAEPVQAGGAKKSKKKQMKR